MQGGGKESMLVYSRLLRRGRLINGIGRIRGDRGIFVPGHLKAVKIAAVCPAN
jgi:hypothetical protein